MENNFLLGDEFAWMDNDPRIASAEELARRSKERLKLKTEHAILNIDPRYESGKPPPLGRKYVQFKGSDDLLHWYLEYDQESSDRLCPQDGTLNGFFKNLFFGEIKEMIPENIKLIKNIPFGEK